MKSRTSLTIADCGNFAAILAQPETVKSLHVATLYGICSDISQRKSPDKTITYNGLKGAFRVKLNGDADGMESGHLYFPPAFNKLLDAPVAKMQANVGTEITFCYDLMAVRAKNEAGFTMDFVPRVDAAAVNRMDDFVAVADKAKATTKK